MQLKLSRLPNGEPEIFASIQGEGASCGRPSVFVRLALCNLACTWCDTKYTWDWSTYEVKSSILQIEASDVASQVRRIAVGENVVITGGEPLLQVGPLEEVARRLKGDGLRIEVETNGTLLPGTELAALVDQWNVSPKLASSGNPGALREAADALSWFSTCPGAYFKFVVVGPDDLGEIETLVCRHRIGRDRVLLMPEGTSPEVLMERSRWLVERCIELGYGFSPRLHILLWGDERGR